MSRMISFRCPHCHLETNVDAAYAGQTGPCAGCGRPVTIPLAAEANEPPATRRRPAGKRRLPTWFALVLLASLVGLTTWIGSMVVRPIWQRARVVSKEKRCHSNMRSILDALNAYHSVHGRYPPAYTVDAAGKPMHSWRVLILPYLGPESALLYERLDLISPLDSPSNSRYHALIPAEYSCPMDRPFAPGDTSYCVVSGPGFAFNGAQSTQMSDITDPPNSTVLVFEVGDSGINWMQPADLSPEELLSGIQPALQHCCGSRHRSNDCTAGLANGNVATLPDTTPPDELRSLATIAGSETTPVPTQSRPQ